MKAKTVRKPPRRDPIEEMAGEPLTPKEQRELWMIIIALLFGVAGGAGMAFYFTH
jgi:hypothetical protein